MSYYYQFIDDFDNKDSILTQEHYHKIHRELTFNNVARL
jgi:hypothetical protein